MKSSHFRYQNIDFFLRNSKKWRFAPFLPIYENVIIIGKIPKQGY